jgi:hypothetical protein
MEKWIRNKKHDTWHFHRKCRHYRLMNKTRRREPSQYVVATEKPKSGEFCDECLSKAGDTSAKRG